ncbi:MAG: glutamine synthetase, partial [Duncaniella sp.]|nr:glutamine synthetase [Duncaniella sp.]
AECLEKQRSIYESRNVFAPAMLDDLISQLKAFDDKTLASRVNSDPIELQKLVNRYFYCG